MPQLNFLEIGHESRIRSVLEHYPDTRVQYIVSTELVSYGKPAGICETMGNILEQVQGFEDRFTMSVADLEYDMPDENLLELVRPLKQ